MSSAAEPILDCVILSDSVIREHGTGKLSLIGIFSCFNLPSLPFSVPKFFVTARIKNIASVNQMTFAINIKRPNDAAIIAHANGSFGTKSEKTFDRRSFVEIPIAFNNIVIDQVGIYEVEVFTDGNQIGKTHLVVNAQTA